MSHGASAELVSSTVEMPPRGLQIGLEIHTQLCTPYKLFSLSPNKPHTPSTRPNSQVSFFDVSIPGTQPKLNPQPLLMALKLAKFFKMDVSRTSSFDRKHYFYGDQPLGYQITQHYRPIAKNGQFVMSKSHYDKLTDDLVIRIEQIQLEQDTGRSVYKSNTSEQSLIDFNRADVPLIELVTKPDFSSIDQIRSFLQTYIKELKSLNVSIADVENVRVDVNINVKGHDRVEIKNLTSIGSILSAIRFESKRQQQLVDQMKPNDADKIGYGGKINGGIETRGWNGKETIHLRSKESNVDYRYVPDMELPLIKLQVDEIMPKIKLPKSYHKSIDELREQFKISLRDCKILINDDQLLQFYQNIYYNVDKTNQSQVINWVVHDLLGCLTKSEMTFTLNETINETCLIDLINQTNVKISKSNAKLLLLHLINNKQDQSKPVLELAEEFDMIIKEVSAEEIEAIVSSVVKSNSKVIDEIVRGKKGKINFLIGQCMRAQSSVKPATFEKLINNHLNSIIKEQIQ